MVGLGLQVGETIRRDWVSFSRQEEVMEAEEGDDHIHLWDSGLLRTCHTPGAGRAGGSESGRSGLCPIPVWTLSQAQVLCSLPSVATVLGAVG